MHCGLNRWLVVLSFCTLACVGCAGDATDNARLDSLEGAVHAAELPEAIDPVVNVPDAEPGEPPSTLRHGAKIIGREGYWRPVKWSVSGDHVAIITRHRQAPASAGRVYYYNASTQALTLIAADAKANVPVPWNGLHYKAGGIGVDRFLHRLLR